jgi:hypothetical protein
MPSKHRDMKAALAPFPSLASTLCSVIASLGLTAACATEDAAKPAASTASIQALIGDAGCDSDAQCSTIGVGAKACGGPDAYLALSPSRTDAAGLRATVDRQAAAQRKAIEAKGMMSNCSVVPDPGAFCDVSRPPAGSTGSPAGVCRLRSTKGAGGALMR